MGQYKDLFGREIKVGDYIAYAALDGRCAVLRAGQVIELTKGTVNGDEKKTPKVKVKSAYFGVDCHATSMKHRWVRQKNVTLGFLDRLIVVDNPPEEVVNVLKDERDQIFWGKSFCGTKRDGFASQGLDYLQNHK